MHLKIISIFSIFFLCATFTFGQQKYRNDSREYAVEKGDFMLSVGYATPSIVRTFLNKQFSNQSASVSGVGPVLAKLEYMIGNRFGVCINGSFSSYKIAWLASGWDTVQKKYRPFEMGVKSYELAGTVRGNYHFWKRAKIDSYAGIGVGYGLFHISGYTTAHTTLFSFNFELPPTLSLECTYGIKYFPLKNLGVFAELGLGKSWILFDKYFIPEALIQAGITLKI